MSTGKQAEAGLSLEAQIAKVRAMGEVKGVAVDEILVDAGASAKSLNRPELRRLLGLVDAHAICTIIVAKLDRLTRSIADLCVLLDQFERRRVSLVSVAESLDTRSSAGRLVIHIMGSVSQWEREAIGERTRDVLQHKRANGECVGTLPFGQQLAADGVHLEVAPVEQRLLARMRALKAQGCSMRRIAESLTAEGFTTRRGTAWQFQNVAHALKASA